MERCWAASTSVGANSAACPPASEHNPLDLRVARQLLENPAVYARMLGNDPVRLAHNFHAVATH